MFRSAGRAVRAWQRLQRDDFLKRPRNVYQYAWDAARVCAVGYGSYCVVKLAWESVYEYVPDAFRSAELVKASEAELQRELGQAWNPREGRPMSEREFLVLRALERRNVVEAAIGWDRPVDMSAMDMATYAADVAAGRRKEGAAGVWARLGPQGASRGVAPLELPHSAGVASQRND